MQVSKVRPFIQPVLETLGLLHSPGQEVVGRNVIKDVMIGKRHIIGLPKIRKHIMVPKENKLYVKVMLNN